LFTLIPIKNNNSSTLSHPIPHAFVLIKTRLGASEEEISERES